ncbi:branched-chain amino acid ABC transporter permease [Desulforhopalus singaporensis]|uniref:Branched-chain amino acid transport system permease protein n=1 Tax=Desulforhopalus singaporensis TaxID=91360 RepID=A0A1H0UMH9_9BACT|nr:branched-chain amino acid ABC transporter permease [Desulforhopalus singaporensis]SDP67457.1 branched-chain amino acid transport system permease protein [Desulforhopalus singaporensis]
MTGKKSSGFSVEGVDYEKTGGITGPESDNSKANRKKIEKLLLAATLAATLVLPIVVVSPTYLHIIILILFYAYLTSCWNMVGGFAGVLPLGHSVFIGCGAYTSTILSLQYGLSPWLGMIIGGILATFIGVLIALPTFKLRGAYFALATIAFAEGIRVMIENIDYLGPFNLNGPRGLQIPPLNTGFTSFMFETKEPYYYIILVMLIAILTLTWFISRSKLGFYLSAGGEEPEAAMALGVNVTRAKLTAMAMSSFFTALAGTFYAQFSLFIHPKSIISLDLSFEIAFIALIGGRGSIAGPVLGALLLRPVSDFSRIYFGDVLPGLHLVIFGGVLILVMIYQPRGIQEPLTRVYKRVVDRLAGISVDEPGKKVGKSKEATA